ncbi:MAG: TIGR00282 family metallophosphoesterase [Alphaproteobacteria bacterium]
MRILFCGDIVGRSGRDVVVQEIPKLREAYAIDFVIANGENAAHGFGISANICKDLYAAGVDVITTGNHVWDHKDIMASIDQDKRLLRPLNYPATAPGRGYTLINTTTNNQPVLVMNAMGRLFMDPLDDPFRAVDEVLARHPLGQAAAAIILDFHGEASSEKMVMGHFCDGRVSLVVGTHTHIPTADAQILSKGTGYQTDAGMCGDYDSVIGMEKDVPIMRMTRKTPTARMKPAQGPGTFCGTFIETDDQTGLTVRIKAVRVGPRLEQSLPD